MRYNGSSRYRRNYRSRSRSRSRHRSRTKSRSRSPPLRGRRGTRSRSVSSRSRSRSRSKSRSRSRGRDYRRRSYSPRRDRYDRRRRSSSRDDRRGRGRYDRKDRRSYPERDFRGDRRHNGDDYDRDRHQRRHERDDFDKAGRGSGMIMTFKEYTNIHDLDDSSASLERYNVYKAGFHKNKVEDFFSKHKDEDWFMEKYLSANKAIRNEEVSELAKTRLETFCEIVEDAEFEESVLSLNFDNQEKVLEFFAKLRKKLDSDLELELVGTRPSEASSENTIETMDVVENANENDESGTPIDESKKSKESDKDDEMKDAMDEDKAVNKDDVDENKDEAVDMEPADNETDDKIVGENETDDKIVGEDADDENKEADKDKMKEDRERDDDDDNDEKVDERSEKDNKTAIVTRPNTSTKYMERVGFIKPFPPSVSRKALWDALQENNAHVIRLCLSDPVPSKAFHRLGWMTFDSSIEETDSAVYAACTAINQIKVADVFIRSTPNRRKSSNRVRTYPLPDLERTRKDLKQLQSLCDHFNKKRNLDTTMYDTKINLEPEDSNSLNDYLKTVDRLIIYLRAVHCYCYFSGLEADEMESLRHFCGDVYVRFSSISGNSWEKLVDDATDRILKSETEADEAKSLGLKNIEEETENFIKAQTDKVDDSKYKCTICSKCFKGEEYVLKHVPFKHQAAIDEHLKVAVEFFNNYVLDNNRPVQEPRHSPSILGGGGGAPNNGPPIFGGPGPNMGYGGYQQNVRPPLIPFGGPMRPYNPRDMRGGHMGGGFNSMGGNGYFDGPMEFGQRDPSFMGNNNMGMMGGPMGFQPMMNRGLRPPPPGAQADPRMTRQSSYVDLDAPSENNIQDFREATSYADL